jgi:N utilization substance protein B
MSRKNSREKTMHLLYQMEMRQEYSDEVMDVFFDSSNLKNDEKEYIQIKMPLLLNNKDKIDDIIRKFLVDWTFERISKIDLSILRIALFEIEYCEDIPIEVSINEAVEMAKKYSEIESSKFINGLLGKYTRSK